MSEHYYTTDPTSQHEFRRFQTTLAGEALEFLTDAGVFARDKVDAGSRLLIESVAIGPEETVLDLGCGYGPLGVAAARKASRGRVFMVDVNARAVELATENARANRVHNVEVRQSDGFQALSGLAFDLILTNPPIRAGKSVIYRHVEESIAHLKPGGRFVAVIQRKQGADSFRCKVIEVYGNARDIAKGGGYRVIEAVKR